MPHQTREYDYASFASTSDVQAYVPNNSIPFISFRCSPTLFTLPPELLSRIAFNLSLHEYSFLSRTCLGFHKHLFHPAELVQFLKTRYRLSIESGSIVIFAYLANMQFRAPSLLERIFEDFFADSPLQLQEEEQRRIQILMQTQILAHERTQMVTGGESYNNTSIKSQYMDSIEVHKNAEKARRQAKWDAVRMLGVLYALDKTHVGPTSSSTSALVLCGASDTVEQPTPMETGNEPIPENEYPQPCKTQAVLPSSARESISPRSMWDSISEATQNDLSLRDGAQRQHRQQAIEQGCLMTASHAQLVIRQSRRSLSQETYSFQNTPLIDVDPHRSVSLKRNIRCRPSPLMNGRDNTIQTFGYHRRDRSMSQPYGECRLSSPPHANFSASAPSLATSSWQEFALSPNIHITSSQNGYTGFFNTRKGSSILGIRKYAKQRSKEVQTKDITCHHQVEMSDPHINTNDLDHRQCPRPLKSDSLSSSINPLAISEDFLMPRRKSEEWDKSLVGSSILEHITYPSVSDTRSESMLSSTPPTPSDVDSGSDEQNEYQSYQPQQPQPILNRSDKIAFLTKYTDRMHRKLQALEIKDWKNEDIQRKKTYQLMIQHNDKTGEKDLVDFYLGRYGGSVRSSREQEQQHVIPDVGTTMAA
ncbi:hypothetical protein BGZ76_003409 [Entomortierella beljakovae]|nr:hypothetical protein BGZ76_003409 [Entomortierella beljakovae]